jgi:hypothetical protein
MYTVKVTELSGRVRYYKADNYTDASALCAYLNESDMHVNAEIL